MRVCELHDKCIVVHDAILTCPLCEEIDKMKDDIENLESTLDDCEEN